MFDRGSESMAPVIFFRKMEAVGAYWGHLGHVWPKFATYFFMVLLTKYILTRPKIQIFFIKIENV